MAMENRTGMWGFGLKEKALGIVKTHKKLAGMAGSAAAGYIMASSEIFGGISPFGVAFCAVMRAPYAPCAALGAVLGYTFRANPLVNMKYIAAVILVAVLKWLLGGRLGERFATVECALVTLTALGVSGAAMAVLSDATLYDGMLAVAEVFLGAGASYFFHRAGIALRSGIGGLNRSDLSCVIVSFGVVVMGLSSITVGGISVGRAVSVLAVLLCARAGGEAGGAVAGITAGIAVGLSGGDFAYAISAYGFGGLMAGVFAGIGRIAGAGAFILVNAAAALFTKSTGEVYIALAEIFIASVAFAAAPQSAIVRLRMQRFDKALEKEASSQGALRGRLAEVSGALREIGLTTREVGQRLGKLEQGGCSGIYSRVADRVCARCGMKTTCWQTRYSETMNAMNDAITVLRQEGAIGCERTPKHFADSCQMLDEFLAELNAQFCAHIAREGVQRKVARVREVVNEQFEGLAMMLDEISDELCAATLLDARVQRQVREYFEREGYIVEQTRCFTDRFDRTSVEITIPAFEIPKLDGPQTALDLSALLEAEFDLPCVAAHGKSATAIFTEKATFSADMGVYQIAPEQNRLCGDAYGSIRNRGGRAHFLLSDGMGSGGGAAVDANMAVDLLSRLISVGLSHEAALKMVNSALFIKSGEESLATIDVCTIDLYTGRADFYKAGAAPTFVIRGGHVGQIESTSLPAGILQGVSFDKSGLTLREGDVIVMTSDGVVATGVDWVRSELSAICGDDMQRLAEKLAVTARIRRADGREDDISVLAVALRKGV